MITQIRPFMRVAAIGCCSALFLTSCFHDKLLTGDIIGVASLDDEMLVDSDVNDDNALINNISNNSDLSAQAIPNPARIGGYVNRAFQGPLGQTYQSGDTVDSFAAYLHQGQSITLEIMEDVTLNNLDLSLRQNNGAGYIDVVTSVKTGSSIETIEVPADGEYVIQVSAVAGASQYILNVDVTSCNNPQIVSALSVNSKFVPGEVIVEFVQQTTSSATLSSASGSTTNSLVVSSNSQNPSFQSNTLQEKGLLQIAGDAGRDMLFRLPTDSTQKISTLSVLGASSATQYADPILQKKQETIDLVKALRQQSNIKSARLNYIHQASLVPNDTEYSQQSWHYDLINLTQAWDVVNPAVAGQGVVVAVLDTGILTNHPDFLGQLVDGYDFVSSVINANDGNGIDADPSDDSGGYHGTHVAGTIAAVTNNGLGVAGIAGAAKLMPLRVLGINGSTDYDIEQAILYAAGLANDSKKIPATPADIINLSLGSVRPPDATPSAYVKAREKGIIIVAAAGNEYSCLFTAPASYDGVVAVSAVNSDSVVNGNSVLAAYSNFGPGVDVAAPGGNFNLGVVSTTVISGMPSYGESRGTSMASPHVAGVATLMKSVYPGLTAQQFDTLLIAGSLTQSTGVAIRSDQFGYGLINAEKAIAAANQAILGNIPVVGPVATVSEINLYFSAEKNQYVFNVRNIGDTSLNITSIVTNDSWLAADVQPFSFPMAIASGDSRDINVQVDRSGLAASPNIYQSVININSDSTVGSIQVPVYMQLNRTSVQRNGGLQYIVLQTQTSPPLIVQELTLAPNSTGVYPYRFNNVEEGYYTILALTDLNNDGDKEVYGESVGGLHVHVVGGGDGFDFNVEF